MKIQTRIVTALAALTLAFSASGCIQKDVASDTASSVQSRGESLPDSPQTSLYDQGLTLISKMREMASSTEYLSLYTDNADIQAIAVQGGMGKNANPEAVYQIAFPGDSALVFYQLEGEKEQLSQRLQDNIREKYCSAAVFANANNATYGAAVIAAFSICTVSEAFVYPGLQENVLYLYQYTDAVPAAVSFVKGEDGTVSANGMFVYDEANTLDGLLEQLKEAGAKVESLEKNQK